MMFPTPNRIPRGGFTLVEVVLAIGISVGILVVALVFYNQSANLRNQLLEQAETLSALRLAMDKLSSELQTAVASPQQGFFGNLDSLQFTSAALIDARSWNASRMGRPEFPLTDLKLISYRVVSSLEGTNAVVQGLERTEEPLLLGSRRQALGGSVAGYSTLSLSNRFFSANTNGASSVTNQASLEMLNSAVRFLRFRFWDGSRWIEQWSEPGLPRGVEITVSAERVPAEAVVAEGLPDYEIFRRVVFLPSGNPPPRQEGPRT